MEVEKEIIEVKRNLVIAAGASVELGNRQEASAVAMPDLSIKKAGCIK